MKYNDLWQYLLTVKKPIYLYGMGNGADMILKKLASLGLQATGVFASDNFVRHQRFHHFTVCTYAQAKAIHPQMLVLVAFGSNLPEVIKNIQHIAYEQETYAPSLPLFGDDFFTSSYASIHASALEQAYSLLEDDISRKTFRELIAYKISGRLQHLWACETAQAQVFQTFFTLNKDEIYVDMGAYDGDTILQFTELCPCYCHIYGIEPDKKTFRKLINNTAHLARTSLWNVCSGAKPQFVSFDAKGGRQSALGSGKLMPSYPLDRILNDSPITYIKLDIEGQEANALCGAKHSIRRYKPKLLVSAYHRSEDLFRLPLLIKNLHSDYKIYLRHHPYVPEWDTNFYCI